MIEFNIKTNDKKCKIMKKRFEEAILRTQLNAYLLYQVF